MKTRTLTSTELAAISAHLHAERGDWRARHGLPPADALAPDLRADLTRQQRMDLRSVLTGAVLALVFTALLAACGLLTH